MADIDTKKAGAAASLTQIPGISDEIARRLVPLGLISADAFAEASVDDLVDGGFAPEEAQEIMEKVQSFLSTQGQG